MVGLFQASWCIVQKILFGDKQIARFNQLAADSENHSFVIMEWQSVVEKQLPEIDVSFISCFFSAFTAIKNMAITELTEYPPSPVQVQVGMYGKSELCGILVTDVGDAHIFFIV